MGVKISPERKEQMLEEAHEKTDEFADFIHEQNQELVGNIPNTPRQIDICINAISILLRRRLNKKNGIVA